ncbi:penicillin-insensitive murein endopeptidase [Phocoenobacter skyensis]|uniref:Penicillin-insensitive murein endopeptidase n=1 Tax=Phocoenobacter skyensis TaxID=97481 RepID=A0A1H7XP32_9PAST|nr:penicillin-insensitive murein endopeptidase [Pasteurella skyensis]MDP8080071.1 penicillin-insensitive murein endopeptidase [Pasteurella skyensis]MDP8086081.1 penicillin-insensitive murein endopeptidase [Pasteurella skyensis]MDP8173952.1 penicillin-insensitive murein endopeptidase [Pasteurella skyensis]MDP8185754.1 penicillin-insensitive murein endopeptidase [Pasteurella skyensis]QLB22641.1 penicillin-insensitive murein endopeptidase [Pasteurella skyensis]
MKRLKVILFSSVLVLSSMVNASDWEKIKSPVKGNIQSIGSYANGCIIGAKPLALKGKGYQVIRSYKNRFYGHLNLVNFIQQLGKRAKKVGLSPLLIGDMGMPAGGRFSSGHASHQTGLDVDIWLRFGPLTDKQAQKPVATVMVNGSDTEVNANWSNDQATLIRLAAQDSDVARIFVNPAIKVKLCQTAKGDRTWLRKIRPWFGHTAHMHVRLNCPKGSKNCRNQTAIPKGEGCGATLYSWFKPKKHSKSKKKKAKPLPPMQCQMLLSSQGLG